MKKISCLTSIIVLTFFTAGCAHVNTPSAPIDNVISTVGDAFGNVSGHKSATP